MKNLNRFPIGQKLVLESIDAEKLGQEFTKDLLDYGFLPGTEFSVFEKFRSAGKVVVQLGEVKIAIRDTDAEFIYCKEGS